MDSVKINLGRENVLTFNLKISGVRSRDTKVSTRFICEDVGLEYAFPGHAENGNIVVEIPPMRGKITEGLYPAKIEVVVGDRVFTPLSINAKFERDISVVAEAHEHGREEEFVSVTSSPTVKVTTKEVTRETTQPAKKAVTEGSYVKKLMTKLEAKQDKPKVKPHVKK